MSVCSLWLESRSVGMKSWAGVVAGVGVRLEKTSKKTKTGRKLETGENGKVCDEVLMVED